MKLVKFKMDSNHALGLQMIQHLLVVYFQKEWESNACGLELYFVFSY